MSSFTNKRSNDGESSDASEDADAHSSKQQKGPIVSCVVLRADGSKEEIKLDTSPHKRHADQVLGSACTMIGEWDEQQVVIIARQDFDSPETTKPLSVQVLQPPFHSFEIHGDLLLMKLGEDSQPLDYTLAEYEAFQALEIEEYDLSDDDGEEEDGDEDEDNELQQHLYDQLLATWRSSHKGAEPNAEQKMEINKQVVQMMMEMANASGDDDEDDDSGSDDDDEDEELGSDDASEEEDDDEEEEE